MSRGAIGQRFGAFLGTYGLLLILVILGAIFTSLNPHFLTFSNFKNLLEQNSALAIVAVGMTFAIISKNIDLSPGSLIALSGVILALTFKMTGSIWIGIAAGIGTAVVIELFDGFLIAAAGLNPIIVTLAAYIWARGLAISLTGANSVIVRDPFVDLMNNGEILFLSPPLILVIITYIAGWFLLNRTRLGRYTLAIGGDEAATREAGVDTRFYKLLMFGLLGVCTGLGAVVTLSRLGAAAPNAAYGLELDAIVSVIIGGNPFQGGEGSVRKTFIGVLFIAVLNNGLNNLGMRDSYFYLYKGLAIILALFFDVISRRLLKGAEPEMTVPELVPA